jgi:hypothetical protein
VGTRREYDLSEAEPAIFNHVCDTIGVGRARFDAVEIDEAGRRIAVEASDDSALAYLDGFVEEMLRTQKKLRRRVLRETGLEPRYTGDVDAALAETGEVYHLADGLVGIRGRLLRLFGFFEAEFAGLARRYDADENRYPVMIPTEILEEMEYFSHFPQQVTFCSHLPEDLPLLEALVKEIKGNDQHLPSGFNERLCHPDAVLKPAVCLPCYPQQRGRVVPDGGEFALSMQNRVFRYESTNFRSLSRLWDFTVRDVVFFGGYQRLVELRHEVMAWAMDFCEELGLEARLQLANDPFFLDESRNKRLYQRLGEAKYELVVPLPARGGEELAVSSFNLHRDFYTKTYGVRFETDDASVESACMGFGVDRWMYGFLAQRGLDPAAWPARVRTAIEP